MMSSLKTKGILIAMIGVMGISTMTSCKKKEGCTDPSATNYDADADKDDGSCTYAPVNNDLTIEVNGSTYYVLSGTITASRTLTSDKNWYLSGGVFVPNGVTLTINAGTQIFAGDDGTTPFLSVLRGGRLMAEGNASAPIVFTTIKTITGNPQPGDWGGIIVNGRAKINLCNNSFPCDAEGEGGTGTYGGTDDTDNSGSLKYIRVEYAGKILGTDNELNGFSFNAVGSGTTLEHLQAFRGADDGFEFFGGMARLKWAVSSGNNDDSFDWTHGWRGRGQYWVVVQSSDQGGGDRGFECDNWEIDYTVEPYSEPMIANFTILTADDGTASDAVRLRHGTRGKLYNGIVRGAGVGNGINVSDTCTTWMDQGTLVVKSTTSFGFTTDWKNCDPFANDVTNSASDPGVLNGYIGTDGTNATDPASLDTWFSGASFKGAVEAGDDWTMGWVKQL